MGGGTVLLPLLLLLSGPSIIGMRHQFFAVLSPCCKGGGCNKRCLNAFTDAIGKPQLASGTAGRRSCRLQSPRAPYERSLWHPEVMLNERFIHTDGHGPQSWKTLKGSKCHCTTRSQCVVLHIEDQGLQLGGILQRSQRLSPHGFHLIGL